MSLAEELAIFYVIPIVLWLALLAMVLTVWLTKRLEDSLAYLVYLRERKVQFVSLITALAGVHVTNESVKVASGFGWVGSSATLEIGLVASVAGAAILVLFAWSLLWRGPRPSDRPLVLDVPPGLAYSLGVLDRVEESHRPRAPRT